MPEHFYAVVSDIHGNYPAVAAVEEDAKQFAHDQHLPPPEFICLGDTVDYGPQPNDCMAWLARVQPIITVQGNHDAEACRPKRNRFRRVSDEYWATALWTRYVLESAHQTTIKKMEVAKSGTNGLGQVMFFHSDPGGNDTRYDTARDAEQYFHSELPAKLCFAAFGHLHYQMLWVDDGSLHPVYAVPEERSENDKHKRVNHWHTIGRKLPSLINPGSVGRPGSHPSQPNRRPRGGASVGIDDGPSDVRAAYMVFYHDQHGVVHYQWRRVEYERKETLRQMNDPLTWTWPKDLLKADPAPLLPLGHADYEPDQFTDAELTQIMNGLPRAVEKLAKVFK
jgi:predicted phosphodiesterase